MQDVANGHSWFRPRLLVTRKDTRPHPATHGELAQLGERFAGSEEVIGSIPLFSTKQ